MPQRIVLHSGDMFEHKSSLDGEALPVAPSLEPALLEARVPTQRALVDGRVVYICLLSVIIAAAAGWSTDVTTRSS